MGEQETEGFRPALGCMPAVRSSLRCGTHLIRAGSEASDQGPIACPPGAACGISSAIPDASGEYVIKAALFVLYLVNSTMWWRTLLILLVGTYDEPVSLKSYTIYGEWVESVHLNPEAA
jgi:hypothetical protein